MTLEKKQVTIGYMPLTDCLPLLIAEEKQYFKQHGLDVVLQRQNSWATLRDKLYNGYLDAAQMLAPMPIVSQLGVGGEKHTIKVPCVLSQNGNGITLATQIFEEIITYHQLDSTEMLKQPLSAELLLPLIQTRKEAGKAKLRFATVFHFSNHFYQLRSWLLGAGIQSSDVDIVVVPPTDMVIALESGDIDGFCVGSPWNASAVRKEVGVTVVTSVDLWPAMPEKVLGVTESWLQVNSNTLEALVLALKQARAWLQPVSNRFEAARILASEKYLNVELDIVAPALLDSCIVQEGCSPRIIEQYINFDCVEEGGNNRRGYTEWLLQQMIGAGHIESDIDVRAVAAQIYL